MPTPMPPPSEEDVKAALFEALMGEIEPDLKLVNRKKTAKKVAALPPKKQAAKLEYYQECFIKFMQRWPAFIDENTVKLKKVVRDAREEKQSQEFGEVEGKLDSFLGE